MSPALAIPGASSLEDVAELKGGLVRTKEGAYRSGRIRFGGGGDTSALVLTAMKSNPQARGAIDLLPEALSSCRELGLLILNWSGLDELAAKKGILSVLPAAIWDEHSRTTGPGLYLLGTSASSVAGLAARLAGGDN